MKKIIILYYSRTGTTKKVAARLAALLGADLEEVLDTKNRAGMLGYLSAGKDAARKNLTKLEPLKAHLAEYDLAIVGTPVWSWTVSTPIWTLLNEQKNNLPTVAWFCTRGGAGSDNVFTEMSALTGKQPLATLSLLTKAVVQNDFEQGVAEFIEQLNLID